MYKVMYLDVPDCLRQSEPVSDGVRWAGVVMVGWSEHQTGCHCARTGSKQLCPHSSKAESPLPTGLHGFQTIMKREEGNCVKLDLLKKKMVQKMVLSLGH